MSNVEHENMVAYQRLNRFEAALAHNDLSDQGIQSHAGKTALSALLASAASDDFNPEEGREAIKSALRLG